MLRVRPGVLLVRANFEPSSVLIRLDLPTFDLPRKAISGTLGAGKWAKSLADNKNRARIRIQTVSSVWVAHGKRSGKISWLEAEWTFGFDVLLLDGMEPVPECKAARDHQSNQHADQKEQAIGRQGDQENCYDEDRDHQSGRTPQAEPKPGVRSRLHRTILTLTIQQKKKPAYMARGTWVQAIDVYCRAVGLSPVGGVAIGDRVSASDGI